MSAEVDAYLAALPENQRAALQTLRARIRHHLNHHLPGHIECLSYAMPGFRQPWPNGKMVAGYAAFARNCGYYPHSGNIISQFAAKLTAWKTTPGAIRFTPTTPLPEALIRHLLTARLAEIAATGR